MKRPFWQRRVVPILSAALLSADVFIYIAPPAWAQGTAADTTNPGYQFPGAAPAPMGAGGVGSYGGAVGPYGPGVPNYGPGFGSGYLPANPMRPSTATRPSSWPGSTPDPATAPPQQRPRGSTAINPNAAPQYQYTPVPATPAQAPAQPTMTGAAYPGTAAYNAAAAANNPATAAYSNLVNPAATSGVNGPGGPGPAAGPGPTAPGGAPGPGGAAYGSPAPDGGAAGAPAVVVVPDATSAASAALGPGANLPGARRHLLPSPFKTPVAKLENGNGTLHFTGTEIIARVGGDVILAGDLLPMVDEEIAARAKQLGKTLADLPQDELDQARLPGMKVQLARAIHTKVLFNAAKRDIPKDNLPKIEEHANKIFDDNECKRLMEGYGVKTRGELDAKLHEYGASLESARRAFFESGVGTQYLHQKTKDKEDAEITHDQMLDYYREHIKEYETQPRARWEQIQIRYNKHDDDKPLAYGMLAQWGNQVAQQGVPFAEVAKAHSEDASAVDGGMHDWTTQGSLVSKPLDFAIFGLPVGALSPIIEDEQGFSIVRVVERTGLAREPFEEVQADLKKKIKKERAYSQGNDLVERLKARTPIWTIFDAAPAEAPTAHAMGPDPSAVMRR